MCLYPKLNLNGKYKPNKKNGGIVPAVDDIRKMYVPNGCGKCLECRFKEAREWKVRLTEEIKVKKNGKFTLLTFSDESILKLVNYIRDKADDPFNIPKGYDLDNEIATVAMRLFLERWRKKFKTSVRHWFITELGHKGTENIHLHGIIWTDESFDTIENIWKYGFVGRGKKLPNGGWKNYVNGKTINYMCKYVHKTDKEHEYYTPIKLNSPGIGESYIKIEKYWYCEQWTYKDKRTGKWRLVVAKKYHYGNQIIGNWQKNIYNENGTDETYRTEQGIKLGLPQYYRRKLYSDEEREKLWIERLDSNKRFVLGQKVEADSEEYFKLLKEAQKKSVRLGYGGGFKDWERREYEESRRVLMQNKRLKNGRA